MFHRIIYSNTFQHKQQRIDYTYADSIYISQRTYGGSCEYYFPNDWRARNGEEEWQPQSLNGGS